MQRIGLFGGSFNPVHFGHLLVARAALEELALDGVVFVPAAQSPFKSPGQLAPGAQRLQMLRLALAGQTRLSVDAQEIERGGVSYTIDTVRTYRERDPSAEIYCLIGADHVALLPKWRDAVELARTARFVVIPRPGAEMVSFPDPFRGIALTGFPLALSASQIRSRCQAGLPIDFLVPPAVAEAIANNRLYL